MPDITIKEQLADKFADLQTQSRSTVRKFSAIFKELARHPLSGIGKVEKLKGRPNTYSRRLDEKNRIVYEYKDGKVTILDILGYYDDK